MKPILFSWGPITLYSYGLMMALGFLFCLADVRRRGRSRGMDSELLTNVAFAALLGGIAGARLLYILLDFEYFAANPQEILFLNHGGLVWYGGFAGGLLAALLYAKHKKLPIALTFDLFMPGLALAQALGRVGCFLNGCCYGFEADPPTGICLPDGLGCRFPVQLLYAVLLLALFAVLHFSFGRIRRPGRLLWIYGVGYGMIRFVTEFFRGDQAAAAFGLTLPQLISASLVLASALVLAAQSRVRKT